MNKLCKNPECKKEFTTKINIQIFCCTKCNSRMKQIKKGTAASKKANCSVCGVTFIRTHGKTVRCQTCIDISNTAMKDRGGIVVRENTPFEANEIKQYIKLNGVVKC